MNSVIAKAIAALEPFAIAANVLMSELNDDEDPAQEVVGDLPLTCGDLRRAASALADLKQWAETEAVTAAPPADRAVQLGVIEFHSDSFNPGLRQRFYAVTKDLADSGSIVDVWLMDIATVLREHGYTMTITTSRPVPERRSGNSRLRYDKEPDERGG